MGLTLSLNQKGSTAPSPFSAAGKSYNAPLGQTSQPGVIPNYSGGVNQDNAHIGQTPIQQGTNSGLLNFTRPVQHPQITPANSPAIKSQTTSADGTQKTEFHKPDVTPADDPANKYNTSTGALNPNYKDPNVTAPTGTPSSSQTTTTTPAPEPQTSPFLSVAGQLANTGGTPFNTAAKGYIGALGTQTGNNQQLADYARQTAEQAGQDINQIGQQGASSERGQLTTGTSPVAEGNAAVTAQTTAQQVQARTNQANMALAGNAQGLLAQSQAQSGYNAAAGQALSGQQLGQGALGTAGGLLTPQLSQYGQTYYNPANAGINGQGGVSPTDPFYQTLQQYAQLRASGQESLIPSSVSGNAVLNAQVTQMAQQSNPNYNANTAAGQAAAQQHNTTVGGTAPVDAGNTAYQQANTDFLKLQNEIIPNVDQFGSLLTSGAGGLNPFDAKFANKTLAQFKDQLSDPQRANFDSTFQSLQAKIADLLSIGGSQIPTDVSNGAKSILDPNAKLSTIKSTLDRIAQEGHIVLTNKGNLSNAALNQTKGGGSQTSSSGWPGWNGQ